jgi:hypothetical protein
LHDAARAFAGLCNQIKAEELAVPFLIHESRHSSKRYANEH